MELLSLVAVAGLALGWQHWRNTTSSVALLHAVSAALAFLFVAALLNVLFPATILFLVAGIGLAVTEIIRIVRGRIPFPVPTGVLVGLSVLYWTIHSGSSLFYYDEYSHWGVYLREMLAGNALWGADTNALHARYLPGTSLWQYSFAVFSSRPEGAAYLAQFVLLLTPLMVFWEKIRWRQYHWHVGILLLITILLFNFGHGFTSLYVDHLLGTWFAGILLNFLLDHKCRSVRQLVVYLLPLLVLVLIKTTGVLFALADAGIIGLLLLVMKRSDGSLLGGFERWSRAVAFPLAALVLCLSVLSVWSLNRDSAGAGIDIEAGATSSLLGAIASRQSVLTGEQQAELTRRFKRVLLHQQISKDAVSVQFNAFSYPVMDFYKDYFRLTTVSLLGLALIAIFFLWYKIVSPAMRNAWVIAAVSMWLAAVVYIAGLYLGYMYASISDYSLLLSSYVRYAHSMLLPVLLICFFPLVPALAGAVLPPVKIGERLHVERRYALFIVLLAAMYLFEKPHLAPLYKTQPPHDFRAQTEAVTRQLREITGDSTIWVFFPNDVSNGVLGQMLQYQLTPGRVHVEESAEALLSERENLKAELGSWEYVWFANKNPEFREASEALLGQSVGGGLFRIQASNDAVEFVPIAAMP